MGTTSSAIFTGSSAYSADLQNVIARAVSIASLPISQLNSQKTVLTSQSDELTIVANQFTALQTAIQSISDALDGSSYQTDISNPSVVAATVSTGAAEGNYSIEVKDIGAYATSLSSSAWTGGPGAAHTYTLWIGSDHYDFTPADNSAASVAAALNSGFGGLVRATVVNVGPSSAPDYRISLRSTRLADTPLDIKDGGTSLQTAQTVGRPVQYIVNSSGKTASSDTRIATIATGLTVTLLASSASPVDITVTHSSSALSDSLSSFATAYNSAVDELDAQRGQSGGALQGQSVVNRLAQALSTISTYTVPGSSISGLEALGLTLGLDGKLTFNAFSLMAADLSNSGGVAAFLGSPQGGGFLQAAADVLNRIEDPDTGLIPAAEADVRAQIASIDNSIADKQAAVDDLQQRLTEQMAAADALIASMQQQYSYLYNMFAAMQTADQQYK